MKRERTSANLAFEVKDDSFEVSLVEDLFVLGGAQEESTDDPFAPENNAPEGAVFLNGRRRKVFQVTTV